MSKPRKKTNQLWGRTIAANDGSEPAQPGVAKVEVRPWTIFEQTSFFGDL